MNAKRTRTVSASFIGAIVGVIAVIAVVPTVNNAFTAQITGNTSQYGSGALILQSQGSATCTSSTTTITTDVQANCSGTLLPTGLNGGSGSQTDTLSSQSTLTAGNVSLSGSSCGVLTTADTSSAGTNTAVLRFGVQEVTDAPFASSTSLSFNGTNGYLETVVSQTVPDPVTIVAWFKTTSSGPIIDFTNFQDTTSATNSDRALWINNTGQVVFGVIQGNGQKKELTSTVSGLNNGVWHSVVAVLNTTGGPPRMLLYVDGAAAGSQSQPPNALSYTGYWHIGFGSLAGWAGAPASSYFPGELSNVAILPTALAAGNVASISGATSQSAEASAIGAYAPTSYWPSTTVTPTTTPLPGIFTSVPDISGNANTGSLLGGYSVASGAPFGGITSYAFNGTSGWIETTNPYDNPQTFSIGGWFNTAAGSGGGTIIGFTNAQSNTGQTMWDRNIWVDATGHVVFGVYSGSPNPFHEISSTGTYDNGSWHFVIATLSSTTGMKLYVDGTLVASNPLVTAAQVYTGYWHIGWGNETTLWPDPPSQAYFPGSLSNIVFYQSVLSSTQISSLYAASTQTQFQSTALADTPSSYWPLTSTDICALVEMTIENDTGGTTCLLPSGSGACPAPSATTTLAALENAQLALPSIAPGTPLSLKITLQDSSSTLAGLNLSLPLTVACSAGTFTATVQYSAAVSVSAL